MKKRKTSLFTFRRYKKKEGASQKRHPKLIVHEGTGYYGFMGLTESKKRGTKHYNIPLSKNPKKNDKRPAYLRKQIDYDVKDNFGDILRDYNLSSKDKRYVQDFVNKRLKK